MKTLWARLPLWGRMALMIGLALGTATLVIVARKDLEHRDPSTIRGSPRVWDTVTRFPGGAVAYLTLGRRAEKSAS